MKTALMALALAGALSGTAMPTIAQSAPPALPALSAEQSANLEQELSRYQRDIDDRVARGEVRPDEGERLLGWRRWQLARQIAGLTPPEPPRVVVQRQYVVQPDPWAYDPYWYPRPYWGPRYYYGPRVSVCAGGGGRHAFGSFCF